MVGLPLHARHSPSSRTRADPGAPPGLPPPLTHSQRVRKSLAAWRAIGAPPQVLRWISQGVTVKWNERGPPAPFHHGVTRFSPDEHEWLSTERDRCLGTGAWQRATCFDYVSRAFVVTHNGKRRLVIDLRHVNEHCIKRSCRFESLTRLRKLARRHDFMISIDLTDAYHHLAIRPADRHYFTFAIETLSGVEYFCTAALNFGWTLSPWVFTTFMKPVVAYLRHPLDTITGDAPRVHLRSSAAAAAARGTRTLPWLDDFAFFFRGAPSDSPSYPAMLRAACTRRDNIFNLFQRLGLAVAPHKGQHEPSQVLVDHLGYCIDSTRGLFLLTPRREAKLAAGARSLLCAAARGRHIQTARQVPKTACDTQERVLVVCARSQVRGYKGWPNAYLQRHHSRATGDESDLSRRWAAHVSFGV